MAKEDTTKPMDEIRLMLKSMGEQEPGVEPLNCKILREVGDRAYIEADLGAAWFKKSEFSIISIAPGRESNDKILIDWNLAIKRGIL